MEPADSKINLGLCRLCGQDRAIEKNRLPMKKEAFSVNIKKILGKYLLYVHKTVQHHSMEVETEFMKEGHVRLVLTWW